LFVISAGIDCRKNREDRLVRVQSYFRRILRERRKSGEGADKGGQRAAKLKTQEKPPKGVRWLADFPLILRASFRRVKRKEEQRVRPHTLLGRSLGAGRLALLGRADSIKESLR
jgi:hypothetical protein